MAGYRTYGTTTTSPANDDAYESQRLLNDSADTRPGVKGSPVGNGGEGSNRRNHSNGGPLDRSNSDQQLYHDKFAAHANGVGGGIHQSGGQHYYDDSTDTMFLRYRVDGYVIIIGEWLSRSKGYRLIVLGPDWPCALGTLLLLLITTWLVFRYGVKTNIEQIVFGVIALLTVFTFFSVFISDPGLMRKYHHARSRQWTFCDQCDSFRPNATVHCSTCNVCVAGYDHHCPVSWFNSSNMCVHHDIFLSL